MAPGRKSSPVLDRQIRVEFGNAAAHRCVTGPDAQTNGHSHEALDRSDPSVTYLTIPPGYTFEPGDTSPADVALHLLRNPDITRLPHLEAALVPLNPTGGMWGHHSADKPSWIATDHEEYGKFLAEIYDTELHSLHDEDFLRYKEDTHHTLNGVPGVGPWSGPLAPRALKVNAGNDIQAALLGGGQVDFTGQATASSATTLTATGTPLVASAWIGCRVYATVSATQIVWGLVVSNTTSVLTVDRWYTVGTPGGAAGSTPSATATYVLVGAGGPAAWFMGLTATATAPSATDTSLTGEVTSQPAGLIRKICPYAHTAGTNTYTLTPVYTIGGGDTSLPITVAAIGVFNSMVATDTATTMLFHTLLNATATLSASGDQLTVTETVTM